MATNPSVLRRILASYLKEFRKAAGMSQTQAGQAAHLGSTALTRYENGESSMTENDARTLLTVYGVEGDQLEELVDMVKASRRRRGLLRGFKGTVQAWLEELVALERDATSIRQWSISLPGYLQTRAYARAILQGGILGLDVEAQVDARMERAELLNRDDAPDYSVVMSESVIRCRVGGSKVIKEQLDHLARMAQRPHVRIQVLLDSHGEHPAMNTEFLTLGFAVAPRFRVAYLDYLTGSLYMDEPEEVAKYEEAYERLTRVALGERESLRVIEEARDGY
jgi:transcriptional regulator with XRE-family HTH domain